MKEEDFYLYSNRYQNSTISQVDEKIHSLKSALKDFIYKKKYLSRFFDQYDLYFLSKKQKIGKYNLEENFLKDKNEFIYEGIELEEINYFEVIEIDDFDRYRKKILSKFAKHQVFNSTKTQTDLKETLQQIKDNFDVVSTGKLFSINYSKKQKKDNDLIDFASVTYIKTNESYFVLKIQIKPSKKFKKTFKKIVSQKDIGLSLNHFNSFWNILRTKHFLSYESFIYSLKNVNIKSLFSDLNEQVKLNITSQLKGHFHKSRISQFLPCIEIFEVDNIKQFEKDERLRENFVSGLDSHYELEDQEIKIYHSNRNRRNQTLIQIVKEKGHGEKTFGRKNSDKDMTNYDHLETHYLVQSLQFHCFFKGILKEQYDKMNILKRRVYDFVHSTSKSGFFKVFLLFYNNKKYIDLKQNLSQILLTTKRYENEFSKQKISIYSNGIDLNLYKPKHPLQYNDERTLMTKLQDDISYEMQDLDKKTKSINEIFKNIEELNNYRTNYILQLTSLFIAILALIFTFDKAKNLIVSIYNFILQHCR